MKKIASFFSIIFLGIILVACGGDKKYTVTYDVNGGTPNIAAVEVKENGLVTKPSPDPTKVGYTFEYWIESESKTEWKFATQKVTKNITLVAKWKENTPVEQKVKVTFNIGYEGGTHPTAQEIVKGTKASEPTAITRDGYTFLGWYKGDDKFNFTTTINENITLTAKWQLNVPAEEKVTVTFDINYEGGVNPPAQEIKKGTTAVAPTGITRDGYTFLGWYNGDTKFVFTTAINEDTTLTAEWEKEEPIVGTTVTAFNNGTATSFYKEDLEANNASLIDLNETVFLVTGTLSSSYKNPIGLYEGSIRLYANKADGQGNKLTIKIAEGLTIRKISITFAEGKSNPNNAALVLGDKVENLSGSDIVNTTIVRTGLDMNSFSIQNTQENSESSTQIWIASIEITYNGEQVVPTSYTVSFDSNGGSAVASQTVNEGKKATLPTPNPTLDGYTFVGWYVGEAAYDFATPITDDITLVAKWELITVADVSNEAELKAALENENIIEINLLNNIILENKLVLSRNDVKINGNGHKLSLVSPEGWQGAYILQAYKVTGVTITNLVFEGGDAALYVNGSEVTIKNITLNDHEFGGIEVSQGVGVETTPKLTVIGQLDSNLFGFPYIWIDKALVNNGWVILPTELALDEVVYTEAGKEQVWFIDQTVDETAPVLLEKTLQIIDGKLVLVIKAQDDNLYSLEVDHSLNNNEFTVYASEQDPYGEQQAAFEALDVVVVFADGTWTITFGNGAMTLIKGVTQLNEFKVHVVIKDYAGNAFGSMSPTTAENTVSINIYNLDLVEDETTTKTERLFAGELVVLPVLDDKDELLFVGWFTDVELTNEYIEAAIESHLTLYAKFEEVQVEEDLTAKLTYGTESYSGSKNPNAKKDFIGSEELNVTVTNVYSYWEEGFALRLGSTKNLGSITYTFEPSITIHKVIVVAKLYETGTKKLTVNGQDTLDNLTSEANVYIIELTEASNVIRIESLGLAKPRILIESVEIVYTKN